MDGGKRNFNEYTIKQQGEKLMLELNMYKQVWLKKKIQVLSISCLLYFVIFKEGVE